MADLDVAIQYTADTSQFEAAAERAEDAVEGVGAAAQSSSSQATKAIVTLTDAEKRLAAQIVGAEAAMKAKAAATGLTVTQLRAMEKAAAAAAKAQTSTTVATTTATKATAALAGSTQQMTRGFSAVATQLPDVVVQLQAGQNPMQVLLQQGSQVAEQMGIMGQVLSFVGRVLPPVALAAAALGTAYAVLRNSAEDADSAQGLLAARMSGLQHVADTARGAIADLAATTKRFYESVTETEYQAAEATGALTAEEVAQAKAIQALRAQIEPQIKAQETLKAALLAQNEVLRENLAGNRLSAAERKTAKAQLDANRRGLEDLNGALDEERAKLDEGVNNIARATGARMREREETERGTTARKAAEKSRRGEQAAMLEQRWAQEQLNAAFDAEIERLNVRAGFLPTLQAKVEGLSEAEIEYRQTIEDIGDAERMGAVTTQEAYELREAAARDWVAATNEAAEAAGEAEQRLADKRTKDHEQYLKQLDEQYDAQLAIASGILGQINTVLGATTAFSDMVIERGEEAHARLKDLQADLASEQERYAEDQRKAAIELEMRREEMTAAEQEDLAKLNAEKAAIHQMEVARLEAQIQMTRRNTKEARTAASRAAKFAKGAAIADVTFKTAQAIMAAFAQFGPPPSPLGIASAGLAAAAGAIQIGAIAATDLPTYHTGGVKPGETLSRHLPGEGVLNATATRDLGVQGVRDLNSGRMGGATVLRIGRAEVREMQRIEDRAGLGLQVGRGGNPTRGMSGREVIA